MTDPGKNNWNVLRSTQGESLREAARLWELSKRCYALGHHRI